MQVHRLLHELYGQVITTKSYTSQHRKRAKRDRAATGEEECPPQIVIRFRDTVRDNLKRKAGRDVTGTNLYTKFVFYKENVVSTCVWLLRIWVVCPCNLIGQINFPDTLIVLQAKSAFANNRSWATFSPLLSPLLLLFSPFEREPGNLPSLPISWEFKLVYIIFLRRCLMQSIGWCLP